MLNRDDKLCRLFKKKKLERFDFHQIHLIYQAVFKHDETVFGCFKHYFPNQPDCNYLPGGRGELLVQKSTSLDPGPRYAASFSRGNPVVRSLL